MVTHSFALQESSPEEPNSWQPGLCPGPHCRAYSVP